LRSKTGSAYYVSEVADLAAREGELDLAVRLFGAVAEQSSAELDLGAAADEAIAWASG
jgi:hypothetical protein